MRFLPPIGSPDERRSGQVPPGKWSDATGYARYYNIKPGVSNIHTGNDWNLNYPGFDADAHSDVYAIGPGVVVYAQKWPNPSAWGEIIVIDHGIVDGGPCYSRYAHVEHRLVSVGDVVNEWSIIAKVGNGNGLFAYHLHFDISLTDHLKLYPGDWPGTRMDLVKLNYTDPVPWLLRDHVVEGELPPPPPPDEIVFDFPMIVVADLVKMRADHSTKAAIKGRYGKGTKVMASALPWTSPQYDWRNVKVNGVRGWICERENTAIYLEPDLPEETIRVRSTGTLVIRSQPSKQSADVGRVIEGAIVEIKGSAVNGYIQLADESGWILFSYLVEV